MLTCLFVSLNDKKSAEYKKDKPPAKLGLYIAYGEKISFSRLNAFLDLNDMAPEPKHCQKANITK